MDPATFASVALVRDDFGSEPLDVMLAALAANATSLRGLAVQAGTRQLGAWVQLTDVDGAASVIVALRDGEGRSHQLLLGRVPERGALEWGFVAADLATPFDAEGSPIDPQLLTEPLSIHGYYLQLDESAAGASGSAALGPLVSTLDEPSGALDAVELLVPRSSAFDRRAIIHDLASLEGFEPLAGAPLASATTIRDTSSAPAGFEQTTRIDWPATPDGAATRVRGLQQATEGGPVLLYVDARSLDTLGVTIGAELALSIDGRPLFAQVAGALDHFPTLGTSSGGFAVAGLDRVLAAANASPAGTPITSNEAWLRTSSPARATLALGAAGLDVEQVADRRAELAGMTEARALALGWRGLAVLAAAGAATLALVAVAVEAAGVAARARRDAAITELLGGRGGAEVASALASTAIRVAVGTATGIVAGDLLATRLLTVLGTTAEGAPIVPPLRIEGEGNAVWAAMVVLAAAFAVASVAAALRYRRPAARRALWTREA